MKLKSPAKINIFLEITGKDGNFHKLHSLFVRINLFDEIAVKSSNQLLISYNNQCIEGDIIQKTVNLFQNYFPNANINFAFDITKNIPIGAGLGGASSNAAEILKFLILENNIKVGAEKLLPIGREIGADVPFFLCNGTQILNGTSLELSPISFAIPKLWCVIAFPKWKLLTKNVFAKLSHQYTQFKHINSFDEAILRKNDMQKAADEITSGLISSTLRKISHKNAIATKMSGSGCACFSLFTEKSSATECYNLAENNGDIEVFIAPILDKTI